MFFSIDTLLYLCNTSKLKRMQLEIERKYLVLEDMRQLAVRQTEIRQGYLSLAPDRSVRVRLTDHEGYLTVKGVSRKAGLTRMEWEKKLDRKEALDLFELCLPGAIEKTRYYIPYGRHTIELDVFKGDNAGLLLAEVELKSEHDVFDKPAWLGAEVTGQTRYYNAYLSKHPFCSWTQQQQTT